MDWRTKLLNPAPQARRDYTSLVTPVYRGSTVVFDDQAAVSDDWRQAEMGYSYGLYGTPTTLELAARITEIEGGRFSFVVPGGQAAIALIYLAYCTAGTHALVPHSAYGPNKAMAEGMLRGLGIEVEPYDPIIGAGIAHLIRDNTALIWCESPGSVTMEIQDVPAIVSARDEAAYQAIGPIYKQLGLAVSPDDCSLALRGLQTLAVRLAHLEKATREVAQWLHTHPLVAQVFHPALPDCPGHDLWQRDFSGSSSVFSFTFVDSVPPEQVIAWLDRLEIFRIGMSWGGVNSLAVVYPRLERPNIDYGGRLVRLNIGLEDTLDLIADLTGAFAMLQS